tara:strand:- start:439 stop:852 length:414 start_codon:yes stop_codon:yes gene_type:complete
MAIPSGLIPSDEKREIDKKKLSFAVVVVLALGLPMLIGVWSGLSQLLKPGLDNEKIFVVGLLSAYKCHTNRYRMNQQKGHERLVSLMNKRSLDLSMLSDPILDKVADVYSRKLHGNCESAEASEKRTINNIYRSIGG